ncbi:hypothetical protein H4683_002673 [Filibacter limicola]|uniref:Uncharacterized protein n=1 Tax=Sporosarcina limicola TaxID=34101 RepID=A0A927MKE8_9BACL|nr:hypothetical protein [Sporosarcina limicola]
MNTFMKSIEVISKSIPTKRIVEIGVFTFIHFPWSAVAVTHSVEKA